MDLIVLAVRVRNLLQHTLRRKQPTELSGKHLAPHWLYGNGAHVNDITSPLVSIVRPIDCGVILETKRSSGQEELAAKVPQFPAGYICGSGVGSPQRLASQDLGRDLGLNHADSSHWRYSTPKRIETVKIDSFAFRGFPNLNRGWDSHQPSGCFHQNSS